MKTVVIRLVMFMCITNCLVKSQEQSPAIFDTTILDQAILMITESIGSVEPFLSYKETVYNLSSLYEALNAKPLEELSADQRTLHTNIKTIFSHLESSAHDIIACKQGVYQGTDDPTIRLAGLLSGSETLLNRYYPSNAYQGDRITNQQGYHTTAGHAPLPFPFPTSLFAPVLASFLAGAGLCGVFSFVFVNHLVKHDKYELDTIRQEVETQLTAVEPLKKSYDQQQRTTTTKIETLERHIEDLSARLNSAGKQRIDEQSHEELNKTMASLNTIMSEIIKTIPTEMVDTAKQKSKNAFKNLGKKFKKKNNSTEKEE